MRIMPLPFIWQLNVWQTKGFHLVETFINILATTFVEAQQLDSKYAADELTVLVFIWCRKQWRDASHLRSLANVWDLL